MGLIRNLQSNIERFVFGNASMYRSFGFMSGTQPSLQANEDSYRGIFFRCLEMRANRIATAFKKMKVERLMDQNEAEEVDPDFPWVRLLKRPNESIDPHSLYRWTQLNIDLVGHADFAVQFGTGNVPTALIPIFRQFGEVYPKPNKQGGLDGWTFHRNDGRQLDFAPEEIVRIARPSPLNRYESTSLVKAAAYELDIDRFMKIYRRDTVEDGGLTSVVLSSDQHIAKEQRRQMGQDFKDYMGRKGRGEVFVAQKGLEPVSFGMDARDLEFIDGQIQNWDEISFITGVPEALFRKEANRANAQAAKQNFIENAIQPTADMIASQLTLGFERAFGADKGVLQVTVPDLKPINREQRRKERESKLKTGQTTINELRREDGKDEYDAEIADEPLIQGTLIPATSLQGMGEAQDPERTVKKK